MLLSDLGIRKQTVAALNKKHIFTVNDIVRYIPKEYHDYRKVRRIQEIPDGKYNAVAGKLLTLSKHQMKNQKREYMVARLIQDDGTRFSATFFSGVYLFDAFKPYENRQVVVGGKITKNEIYGYQVSDPEVFTPLLDYVPTIHKKYGKIAGVSDEMLARLIKENLSDLHDPVEEEIKEKCEPLSRFYPACINDLHFPHSFEAIKSAQKRLLYDDLLYFSLMQRKNNPSQNISNIQLKSSPMVTDFVSLLPYELTPDQKDAIRKMILKAKSGERNNVLLQGDVGCGKTIVAAIMMMCAAANGYQSVLMAPRQVLAKQHYDEIKGYADKMGITTVFLGSSMKAKEKKAAYENIKNGTTKFIIGTHACLSDALEYNKLGLIVTDEEHLFGVKQKEKLKTRAEEGVHYIAMSATPIPRTMGTIIYGDSTQILTIKTKPAGRKDIITEITDDRERAMAIALAEAYVGHQTYVVCPAIEDDEEGMLVSIDSVAKAYHDFFDKYGIKIAVVHGKMKKEEIAASIDAFSKNEAQILISTTVIEVGVNVPNATLMIIEQADRFGLASLHQLRGRVGRSDIQSYCYLVSDDVSNERLLVMRETNDGFKIAEADFHLRGSGNLIGTEQSGKNKYVNMMLNHPEEYMEVYELSKECFENGWGNKLIEMCEEHDLAQDEYNLAKAAKEKL